MVQTAQHVRSRPGWRSRTAGALLIVVGTLNAVLGALALTTDQVLLGPAVAGGLIVAGAITAAAGVLVWRGNRLVTAVALTIMGLLLVVQLGDLVVAGTEGALPRLVVMVLLVAALGLAVLEHQRHRRRRGTVR